MLATNFVYNYYVNHLRTFFISLGSGFVCPSGLFGVSGGTLRFDMGCGLSDKLVCVLFWCVYFLVGQRPSLQGEAETGRKLSASLNLFQLCGFLSNVFFSLDTPLVMYNTLGVGGLAIKSETYTKKNCCA